MKKVHINGGSVRADLMLRDYQVGLFPHTKDAREAMDKGEVTVNGKKIDNSFIFQRFGEYTVVTKNGTKSFVLI